MQIPLEVLLFSLNLAAGMMAVALTEQMEEKSDQCTDFTPKPPFIALYNLADSSGAQV